MALAATVVNVPAPSALSLPVSALGEFYQQILPITRNSINLWASLAVFENQSYVCILCFVYFLLVDLIRINLLVSAFRCLGINTQAINLQKLIAGGRQR